MREPPIATIDPDSDAPYYAQIRDYLQAQIDAGVFRPGAPLPAEHELCRQFGVSKGPVRQAVAALVDRDLVESGRGRRTFVKPAKKTSVFLEYRGFFAELEASGFTPTIDLIECEDVRAGAEVAEALELAPDASVRKLVRVINGDGRPLGLATTWLVAQVGHAVEPDELARKSLFELLTAQVPITRIREEIGVHLLRPREAELLATHEGIPAFVSKRLALSHERRIELTELIVRHDVCSYSIEYTPT